MGEVTYREMRELSYAGFSVFHDEALQPVQKNAFQWSSKIPTDRKIRVRSFDTIEKSNPIISSAA